MLLKPVLYFNNAPNFGSKLQYKENAITYTFNVDDENNALSIDKTVNGQKYPVSEKFNNFCTCIHNLGLLAKFAQIYKEYRRVDLAQMFFGMDQKLSTEELGQFVDLMNRPEKSTLLSHLSKNEIIDGIRCRTKNQLATGEIKAIDPKIMAKIKKHVSDFNISQNTGMISGAHNYEMYEQMFNLASQNMDKEIDVTHLIHSDNNIQALAKILTTMPNYLILGVKANDELYDIKSMMPTGSTLNTLKIKKEKDEDGKDIYNIYGIMTEKRNSPIKRFYDGLFPYLMKHKNDYFLKDNTHITALKTKNKKVKCQVLSHEIINNDTLKSVILLEGSKATYVTKRYHDKQGYYYVTTAKLEDTMKYIKATNPKLYQLSIQINKHLAEGNEQGYLKMLFESYQDCIKEKYPDKQSDSFCLNLNKHSENNEDYKFTIDRETYAIQKESNQDGTSIYKYGFAYQTKTPIVGKTKTVVPQKLMEEVLNHISNNNFKASYKISNDGKIIAYFKYNNVYFKLVLTKTATPTCFPITENDLKKELKIIPDNMPEYKSSQILA